MRTASGGGNLSSARKRRTLLYDAVSTSMENVDSGSRVANRNGLSTRCSYVSPGSAAAGTAMTALLAATLSNFSVRVPSFLLLQAGTETKLQAANSNAARTQVAWHMMALLM